MLSANLRPELLRRIDRGIHVAPQPLLRFGQCIGNALEWHISDDEQVEVAVRPQLATGCRAEHEGNEHAVSDGRQRLSQHVGHTGSLEEERLELSEDWGLAIGLEVDLPPLDGASEEPGAGQQIELSLYSALPTTRVAHDLAQVEGLVRVTQQPAQHPPSRTAEEHGSGFAIACLPARFRTHLEYKRTHYGFPGQARLVQLGCCR